VVLSLGSMSVFGFNDFFICLVDLIGRHFLIVFHMLFIKGSYVFGLVDEMASAAGLAVLHVLVAMLVVDEGLWHEKGVAVELWELRHLLTKRKATLLAGKA